MRFNNHVSLSRDLCGFLDYGPTFPSNHMQLLFTPPAPPVAVPVGLVLEFIAPMYWLPGAYTGAHKFTETVFHCHLGIAQSGHDLGPLLIHISVPPNDLLTQVNMMLSKRKAKFEAGEVKANGKPIACCTFFDLALIPTPMSPCAKIPSPIGGTGTAVLFNSVIVGMHWIDMLAGWVEIVIDLALALASLGSPTKPVQEILEGIITPVSSQGFTDNAGGIWGGLIRLAGQEFFGYHGDASVGWTFLSGWGGNVGIDVARDGETGNWSGGFSARHGPSGANVHESGRIREGDQPGDSPVVEGSGGVGIAGGDYGGSADSTGQASPTADHPTMPTGWDPVFGLGEPPNDGSGDWGDSGTSPLDVNSSWEDLPFL